MLRLLLHAAAAAAAAEVFRLVECFQADVILCSHVVHITLRIIYLFHDRICYQTELTW